MRPQISRIPQMKREEKNGFGLRLICVICEIREICGSASDALVAAERLLRLTLSQRRRSRVPAGRCVRLRWHGRPPHQAAGTRCLRRWLRVKRSSLSAATKESETEPQISQISQMTQIRRSPDPFFSSTFICEIREICGLTVSSSSGSSAGSELRAVRQVVES